MTMGAPGKPAPFFVSHAWRLPEALSTSPPSPAHVLRNGSGGAGRRDGAPEILELEQHGEDALQLAVEVDLVASQPVEPVGVDRLPEGLRPDQVPAVRSVEILGK